MDDSVANRVFNRAILHPQDILALLVGERHLGDPILEYIGLAADDFQAFNRFGIENVIYSIDQSTRTELHQMGLTDVLGRDGSSGCSEAPSSSRRGDKCINMDFGRIANVHDWELIQEILLFNICLCILLK